MAQPATTALHDDRPLIGIGLMVAFCAVMPFGDALIKMMGDSLPVLPMLVSRFVLQLVFLWPILIIRQGKIIPNMKLGLHMWHLISWRSMMQVAGIAAVYFGLIYLPLADNTAICYIFPILMLFVGHFFLKEQVGAHRSLAALVGFVGTLMVVQPNFAAVGLNVLWPIFLAFTFVIFMLVTRQMTNEIDPVTIQYMTSIVGLPVLFVVCLLVKDSDIPALAVRWPQGAEWALVFAAGIVGTFGHLLMTTALKYASSAAIAPMQYLEIPFATLIGWMLFNELPNALAAWGIAVTIGAGLYIIYREQKAQKSAEKTCVEKR